MLKLGMSFSMEQLVIDNDIIGMARYVRKGIKVSEETLDYENIRAVGPGNDFIGNENTMANIELPSHPAVLDRQMMGGWLRDGSKDTADLAHEIVVDALKNGPRFPMAPEAIAAIDAIIEKKRKALEAQ